MHHPWVPVLGALALTAGVCRAEPADPAAAEALFRAGRDAAEHGDPASACSRFEESYRLDPAPGTLLNIASCEEALKHLAQAWEHYRRLLEDLESRDPRRATVQERLSALEPRVPRLTIMLGRGMPPDAEVRRDGLLVKTGGLGVPLPVDPGDHTLTVTADGHGPRRYALSLTEGETRSIEVAVGPETPKNATLVRRPPKAAHGGPAGSEPWRTVGFSSLGIGAASAVATGVLVWRYMVERSVINDQCNARFQCQDEGLRATGAAKVLQTASIVAASVTFVAIGGGLTLLWTHPAASGSATKASRPSGVVWAAAF